MIWLASEDKWGSVLALITGGSCLFFANLDKLKRFKIGQTGLDAETHEVVAEAKDTIKRMQKLAKAYGSMMITQAESSQYVSGPSPQERDAVKDAVAELLSEFDLGVAHPVPWTQVCLTRRA